MSLADDRPESRPPHPDQFEALLDWQADGLELVAGRAYPAWIDEPDIACRVTVTALKCRLQGESRLAARALRRGEQGLVNLAFELPVPVLSPTSRIVFVDADGDCLGEARLHFPLRRASNLRWQTLLVDATARARLLRQRPACLWFTGMSGAGKSTIASRLEQRLHDAGHLTYVLDGDNVRHGLNRDLGFTDADRVENIRRVAEVARLMVDAGLITLVSFISPFRAERDMARNLFAPGCFFEVFVDAPLAECERRDVKGLYAKARAGSLSNFTGIDSPYEPPLDPDLRLDTTRATVDDCVEALVGMLKLS